MEPIVGIIIGAIAGSAIFASLAYSSYQRAKNAWEWGVINGVMVAQGEKPARTPFGDATEYAIEQRLLRRDAIPVCSICKGPHGSPCCPSLN